MPSFLAVAYINDIRLDQDLSETSSYKNIELEEKVVRFLNKQKWISIKIKLTSLKNHLKLFKNMHGNINNNIIIKKSFIINDEKKLK